MDAKKLDLPTVEERLAKLERQNRRLKIAGIVAVVLVPVLVLSCGAKSTEVAEVIRATKFVVVDKDGALRASLDSHALTFRDTDGRTRVKLWGGGCKSFGWPRVLRYDRHGEARIAGV